MGLKVKADFTEASLRKEIEAEVQRYIKSVISVYSKAGKAMVEDARGRTKNLGSYDGGSFGNITWDLRSSIGCAVYVDGVKKFSYFPTLASGGRGSKVGADYADTLVEGLSGIVLVVVAGMEYARAVESKGYNVITNTAGIAEDILERYIQAA